MQSHCIGTDKINTQCHFIKWAVCYTVVEINSKCNSVEKTKHVVDHVIQLLKACRGILDAIWPMKSQ